MDKGNDIKKQIKSEDEIDLRELFKIFVKRKWWFVGTFAIVLIAGLLFTFLKTPTPEYTSTSMLKVKEDYCLDSISEYFPTEVSKLGIGSLNDVATELKLNRTLNKVTKALNYDIDGNDLDKAINISIDEEKQILIITTTYSDPEIAYKMNERLLYVYGKEKNSEFNEVYDRLLQKIEARLADTQEKIEELSDKAEEYIIDFNAKLLKEVGKSAHDAPLVVTTYISPEISGELNYALAVYNDLENINYILKENRELFVDKIGVIEGPELSDAGASANYGRNIAISIFLALIVGVMMIFVVNYFIASKSSKED